MGMNCNERNELGFTIGELSAIEDRLRGSIEPYTPFVVVSPKERSSQELQGDPILILPLEARVNI